MVCLCFQNTEISLGKEWIIKTINFVLASCVKEILKLQGFLISPAVNISMYIMERVVSSLSIFLDTDCVYLQVNEELQEI